mgnify:CR=1 FL=1
MVFEKPTETQQEANERMEEALGQALRWIVGDRSGIVVHRSGDRMPDHRDEDQDDAPAAELMSRRSQ